MFITSTEDVPKCNQLEWKQRRFRPEAGEHFPGLWLLQAIDGALETPLLNDFKDRGEKCVREGLGIVDQTLEGADG